MRVGALLVVALAAGALSGCLDLLARAALDPSGLAKEAGAALAGQTVRSLVSAGEVQKLAAVEQTVSELDQIIAQNPGELYTNDLSALKDHISQVSNQTLENQSVVEAQDVPDIQGAGATPEEMRRNAPRRLGDPGSDPAQVDFQDLRNRNLLDPDQSRTSSFTIGDPSDYRQRLRSRDPFRFAQATNSSLEREPSIDYGLELESGLAVPTAVPRTRAPSRR